uniref:Candidate secreted effector n=1 Tax=Meloidogyne incognita TaxID=6306 RepID=A0A914LZL6_MELIC
MGFFLDNLSLSTWNLALYISIAYLAISIVVYYATFYLKRKRFEKQKDEEDVERWNEDSFLASIKSTRSSKSLKTAKSERMMATTQRDDDEKSSKDTTSTSNTIPNNSVNGLLKTRPAHISARLSDGKSPILPDNDVPKVKMPNHLYFDELAEEFTQELTKSVRDQDLSPPETAHGPSSRSKSSAKEDSSSTHTQTASERSNSEGSSVEESKTSTSAVPPPSSSGEEGEDEEKEKDEDGKEEGGGEGGGTSTEGTSMPEENSSDESSSSTGKN